MGGVSRKLPLCIERLRQPVPAYRSTDSLTLPELSSRILRQTGVRQAFFVDLFGLLCKNPSAASKAFPLKKYAIMALSSVTSAVMYQLCAQNAPFLH